MTFDERLIFSGKDCGDIIRNEHLVRYQFASKFVNNKKVLDIACGSGYGTKFLAQSGASEVIGVDCDEEAISRNKALPCSASCSYKVGNATDIPADNKEFDVVVSFETIEHLESDKQDKFVSEIKRVVSDEGLVFVSTPNLEVFKNKNPFHVKELNRSEFENILKKHFPFVSIMEQGNGIVSFLKFSADKEIKEAEITSSSKPLYFVAICSKKEILESEFRNKAIGSISVASYNRLKNNPVLKISDKIYPLFKKLFRK